MFKIVDYHVKEEFVVSDLRLQLLNQLLQLSFWSTALQISYVFWWVVKLRFTHHSESTTFQKLVFSLEVLL